MSYARFEDVVAHIRTLTQPGLIAIDGLPLSGKSTLADRLCDQLGIEAIFLDDFVLPEADWPADRTPAFPFRYVRYAEFTEAVRRLRLLGETSYFPFDWAAQSEADAPRTVRLDKHVIVEGVSALLGELCPHYALKLYVSSDRASTLEASIARGVGDWLTEWQDWFLPSADLYFASRPETRADLVLAGRGIPI